MLRTALANLDFTQGGDRKLVAWLCAQADVLLLVEAKTHDIASLVPEGWGVLQHTGGILADASPVDKARAGSAIAYREAVVSASDFGLTHGSGPAPGVMRRWIAHATLTETATGRSATFAATHWPLRRTGVQGRHTANVRAWAAKHPALFIGGDGNQPPAALADRLGLEGWGREVMALMWDGCDVSGFRAERVPGSDHPVLFCTVTLREAAMPKPYDITTYDGKRVDWLTRQALEAVAKELNYADGVISLTQGSYNKGGVSASAGTHDGGGVVDIRAYDYERKVRVLRKHGFAAWYRPTIKGLWPAHIHAVQVGNAKLSRAAEAQVDAYLAGKDGLASNGPDNGPREYVGRRWTWIEPAPPAPPVVGRPSRGIKVDQALSLLKDAADHAAGKGWKWRASTIRAAVGILERLPLR